MKKGLIFGLVTLFGFSSAALSAPTQVINNGQLTGINGIEVSGYGTYNLTLNNVWSGNFYDRDFVSQAEDSLVSLYSGSGAFQGTTFDFQPELTTGCDYFAFCSWATALEESGNPLFPILFSAFLNDFDLSDNDRKHGLVLYNPLNLGVASDGDDKATFLDWTPAVSEVPVPAAAVMFAPALLGFLGLRRKAKNSAV